MSSKKSKQIKEPEIFPDDNTINDDILTLGRIISLIEQESYSAESSIALLIDSLEPILIKDSVQKITQIDDTEILNNNNFKMCPIVKKLNELYKKLICLRRNIDNIESALHIDQ